MTTAKTISPLYLQDLLLIKMQALYDIENELVKVLPRLAKAASDDALADAFTLHLNETKTHVERLAEAFSVFDKKAQRFEVETVRGLTNDAEWAMKSIPDLKARDASLIGCGLQTEYYEMATYMVAVEWAELLGFNDVRDLLQQNLSEEQAAAEKLFGLGDQGVYEAAIGDDTEEDADEMTSAAAGDSMVEENEDL